MSKPIVKIGLFALTYLKPISFYNQHQGAQKACKFITERSLRSPTSVKPIWDTFIKPRVMVK